MRYNVKFNEWLRLVLFALMLYFIGLGVFGISLTMIPLSIISFALVIFLFYLMVHSYYKLEEDKVIIVMGFIKKTIKYDSVERIRVTDRLFVNAANFGFCRKQVIIYQKRGSALFRASALSPVDRDEFVFELERKCNVKKSLD